MSCPITQRQSAPVRTEIQTLDCSITDSTITTFYHLCHCRLLKSGSNIMYFSHFNSPRCIFFRVCSAVRHPLSCRKHKMSHTYKVALSLWGNHSLSSRWKPPLVVPGFKMNEKLNKAGALTLLFLSSHVILRIYSNMFVLDERSGVTFVSNQTAPAANIYVKVNNNKYVYILVVL